MKIENKLNKKAQGLVTGLIIGIFGLVITVIVGFVILQTVTDSNLLNPTPISTSNTVTNETEAFANGSAYTVDNSGSPNANFVLTDAWMRAGGADSPYDFQFINLASNLSLTSEGVLTNLTAINYTQQSNISISYTYNSPSELPKLTSTANNLSSNLSEGVNRVAEKVPTILKIAAVVLLLGVLVFLIAQARRMGFFNQVGSGGI